MNFSESPQARIPRRQQAEMMRRRVLGPIALYTRFVNLSKLFLWVAVGLMIGLVVWIASDNSSENGARIVFNHIAKSTAVQNVMQKPNYQGVDAHNQPYTIVADKATQLDAQNVAMDNVRADMTMGNGAWLAMNAGAGHLNLQHKEMDLTSGVNMFYEGGYEFRSDHAHVDIRQGTAYGDAAVQGQGPPGTLTADSFSVLERGKIIRFNGSVKLTLYR